LWLYEFLLRARKISLGTNVGTRNIIVIIPVFCGPSVVTEGPPGTFGRSGFTCYMASSRETLQRPVVHATKPGSSSLSTEHKLGKNVEQFLSGFLPSGANLQFLEEKDDSIEVIVRNTRDYVVQGGHLWEKLQIEIVLQTPRKGPQVLLVYVDGFVASGLGAEYPPDSQFTSSMEPKYFQPLSDFAKKLDLSLKKYLEAGAE
jgi:hypothetical protein